MNRILNIAKDISKNISDQELILTTGKCLYTLYNKKNVNLNDFYLLQLNSDGEVKSYYCLNKFR